MQCSEEQGSAVNYSAVQCSVVVLGTALPCTATNIAVVSNTVQNKGARKCTPMGRNRKSSSFFLIVSVPEVMKLTLMLFSEGINWAIFCVLWQKCYCALAQQIVEEKRHLVNKNLSFVTSGN